MLWRNSRKTVAVRGLPPKSERVPLLFGGAQPRPLRSGPGEFVEIKRDAGGLLGLTFHVDARIRVRVALKHNVTDSSHVQL